AAAHARGHVHGWLKPGDVILGARGVQVADFGLAEAARRLAPEAWRAYAQANPTAAALLPPEEREGGVAPTPSTDTYALGAMLLQGLGEGGMPDGLQQIVETATGPAAGRYRDAGAFVRALEQVGLTSE